MIYSTILAGFIYPIILAWTWGQGWLNDKGFHDFAGTGIIHLVGGISGFWGALIVGERKAKAKARNNPNKKQINVNDPQLQGELS